VSERSHLRGGLRVGFAGTPGFAASALRAIAEAGFSIPLVLTRPDKPKGRDLKAAASEVKLEALRRGIVVLQPPTLRSPEGRAPVVQHPLDVLVVAAYGLILPQDVLAWPRYGCLNIHASRLPRWRGAAPIQRAIEAGDAKTAVTIMQMDEGLDTGPIVEIAPVPIGPRETAGSLHDKLAAVGARTIVDVLGRLQRHGALPTRAQPADGATYARKIGPDDARIDWSQDAVAIDRKVRAFDPVPGASTELAGQPLKVWRAEAVGEPAPGAPGTVLAIGDAWTVATGHGTLRILELQPAGGRRMGARAFAAGRAIAPGAVLGRPRA
jgi:methionyl-tRNA formyltransferase